MDIIPAIDLRDGKCVRLIQGDYDRQILYEPDPVKQAQSFIADGAAWLHVVDLDGAKLGKPVNTAAISSISSLGKLKIEVGGGIRDESSITQLLDLGIQRVIIGTKAVEDFPWFSEMTLKFPNRLVLGLDARGDKVATRGWLADSQIILLDFAVKAAKLPLAAIIYTDIDKDGMMSGPNLERTKKLIETIPLPVIASGGVKSLSDIRNLIAIGAPAAIVGRSLYEGKLNLADAIKAAKTCPAM